jgi:hypothetical protein
MREHRGEQKQGIEREKQKEKDWGKTREKDEGK